MYMSCFISFCPQKQLARFLPAVVNLSWTLRGCWGWYSRTPILIPISSLDRGSQPQPNSTCSAWRLGRALHTILRLLPSHIQADTPVPATYHLSEPYHPPMNFWGSAEELYRRFAPVPWSNTNPRWAMNTSDTLLTNQYWVASKLNTKHHSIDLKMDILWW